jgi:hypothetical protein
MNFSFGFWDYTLIVVVAVQATVLSYLYRPKLKALMLSLPIPFTVAVLALGEPMNATNVLALDLLLLFTNGVRVLYIRFKINIIFAIIIAALAYCLLGTWLSGILPRTPLVFWVSVGATLVLAVFLYVKMPHKQEPGHRTPLPLYAKLPVVIAVVILLVIIKSNLQGFMTAFPMVGVIAAYEARKSLWAICRQIPVVMIAILAMIVTCYLLQKYYSLGISLAVSWIFFACFIVPLTTWSWKNGNRVK